MFFNTKLLKARVKIEHTNALIKNRFPCLKSIPVVIKDKKTMKSIIRMFRCCAVLHNMLVGSPVPEAWYKDEDNVGVELNDDHGLMQPCQEAFERREQIKQYLLENEGYDINEA